MRRLIFILIDRALTPLSQFQFNTFFHWIFDAPCSLHLFVLGVANVLQLDGFASESLSSLCSFYTFLFDLGELFLVILGQNILLVQICDFTDAVLLHLFMPRLLLFGINLLFWCGVKLFLLLLDKWHELVDCCDWVVFCFRIVFAAGAIHVLMLLADQVFNDSFDLRWKVSLSAIPLKGFDMLGKLFPIDLLPILLRRLLSDLPLAFLGLFQLDQLFLVCS